MDKDEIILIVKKAIADNAEAERLKRDSICTAQYEDGTKILTTSNKLIDQAVNIYMRTEGLI